MAIPTNIVYNGDNLDIMRDKTKFPDESVDLIYLDPPFFSGKDYDIVWKDGTEMKSYTAFTDKQFYKKICKKCAHEFHDDSKFCPECGASAKSAKKVQEKDINIYVGWLKARLVECEKILKPTGSIYVHLDHHAIHYVKVAMDEIFGPNNFKTEITWRRSHPKGNSKTFANNSDYILYYVKGKNFTFNIQYNEYAKKTLATYKYNDNDGKGNYASVAINAPGGKGYQYNLGYGEKMPDSGYRWKEETMKQKISDGLVIIKRGKVPRQKRYLSDSVGVPFDNVWTDIENVTGNESKKYPTQKPEALLERIIKASSNPGDIVLDPFCGCGTSIASANELNRKWVGIDVSPKACGIIKDRIFGAQIIYTQFTMSDLRAMTDYDFQEWVCQKMLAKNTSPNPKKPSGPDGGIDGWVEHPLKTRIFFGSPIQVKQSEKIGRGVIDEFAGAMARKGKKIGFFIALSFSDRAVKATREIRKNSETNIILVNAADLCKIAHYDFTL